MSFDACVILAIGVLNTVGLIVVWAGLRLVASRLEALEARADRLTEARVKSDDRLLALSTRVDGLAKRSQVATRTLTQNLNDIGILRGRLLRVAALMLESGLVYEMGPELTDAERQTS